MEEKENNVLGVEESKKPEEKPLTDEEVEESYETEEQEILEPTEEELKEAEKETLEEEAYAEKTENQVVDVRAKKQNTARWEELEAILAEGSIKIWEALNISEAAYQKIKNNNERIFPRKALIIGGLLKHIKNITAILNPTVNSYKRLVPGYEAPVYLAWSLANRSSLIRVPAKRGNATRVELRSPDPSCNPYLAFATILSNLPNPIPFSSKVSSGR